VRDLLLEHQLVLHQKSTAADMMRVPYVYKKSTADSLDQVEYRYPVAHRRHNRISIRREKDISLSIHRSAQVVEVEIGLHVPTICRCWFALRRFLRRIIDNFSSKIVANSKNSRATSQASRRSDWWDHTNRQQIGTAVLGMHDVLVM
jgi:hypothetical protein